MALNKNLIEPLLDWNFITVDKIGSRHVISLTNEGRNALKFLNVSEN
jgi:predicted transcriptional regulator